MRILLLSLALLRGITNTVSNKTEDMPPEKSGKSTQGKAGKTKNNAGKAKTGTPSPSQEARVPMSRAGVYSGKGAV